MSYITIATPPYPFFLYAGDALYRPGDSHRKRAALNCFDILFVEYGCLYMTENQTAYTLNKNGVLVLTSNSIHFGHKPCTEKTRFHWLHFSTTEPFTVSDSSHKYPKTESEQVILPVFQDMPDDKAVAVYHILEQLESLSINRYNHSSMVSKEYSLSKNRLLQQKLFFELLSLITVQKATHGKCSTMLSVVFGYLETHYDEKISLEQMAAIACCHPTHLIRGFKNEYGTTPVKVLTDIRIQKAKELLTTTAFSCEKIAEQTGFLTSSYFSKIFKQYTGMTPEGYRKQHGS